MPSVSLNIRRQLGNLIKRFKFEELEEAVFPTFPEFSWSEIQSELVKNHESFTTSHALKIIEDKIREFNVTDTELRDRLGNLEVIDVSRHYKKKFWYCYELKGKNDSAYYELGQIKKNIQDNFNIHHMQVVVQAVEQEDIIFISVKDKPKKKHIKTILPMYFSLVKNENFFFSSKKTISKSVLIAITNSVGYRSYKQIKLMGRDILSLVKMLSSRKIAILEGGIVKKPLKLRQSVPMLSELGCDFTQHKQRKKYANKCYGINPPTFEFLRVKSFDQTWKSEDIYKNLPNNKIFTGVEFQSNSIPNLLKHLITHKILVTPLPCYAANILSLARNDLTLRGN